MVESIKELRKRCQIYYKIEPHKFFSIYLTKILLYFHPTANQITLLWIIIGLIGSILFIFGNYLYAIIGASCFLLIQLLDECDGEIARYYNICSKKGAYIDHIGHAIIDLMLFVCLTIYVVKTTKNINYVFLGFSMIIGYSLMELSRLYKNELVQKKKTIVETGKILNKKYPSLFKLYIFLRTILFENFPYYLFILVILNHLEFILIGYSIFYHPLWIVRFYYEIKKGFKDESQKSIS